MITTHVAEESWHHGMWVHQEGSRVSGKPVHMHQWRDLSTEIVAVWMNVLLMSVSQPHLGLTSRVLFPDHDAYWVTGCITIPCFSISTVIS
jgi:hypothetical protein